MNLTAAERREWEAYIRQKTQIEAATAPPKAESPEAKRKRIKRALSSVEAFAKEYFTAFMDADFAWFHKKLFREIDAEQRNKMIALEWPREHGKSVIIDVLVPMYLLAKGWLTGMILASETETKAKGLLKDLQAQLEANRRFIADFGDQRTIGTWMGGHFTTTGGIGFWAFGLGQNPAGVREAEKRPNLGILDDADSYRKAKNQERIQEDLDWALGEFGGCLSIKESLFLYANNRVHSRGLTAHLVGDVEPGDPKREGLVHIKAYATEDPRTHAMLMPDAGGVTAWQRYTLDMIRERMARMGYRNAMRQFYHQHIEEGKVFTPEMLDAWCKPLPWRKYDRLITYLDPSWKDKAQNDYKAIVLIGKTGNQYHILWAWLRQTSISNMVKAHYLVDQIVGDCACQHWMEANMNQDQHAEAYKLEGTRTGDTLRIRLDKRKKPDKVDRIAELEPLFSLGLIKWNEKMRTDPDMIRLRDQFGAFPDGPDDGPDAVEGAIWKLKRGSSGKQPRAGKYIPNEKRQS